MNRPQKAQLDNFSGIALHCIHLLTEARKDHTNTLFSNRHFTHSRFDSKIALFIRVIFLPKGKMTDGEAGSIRKRQRI